MVVFILGGARQEDPGKMQNGVNGAIDAPDDVPAADPPVQVGPIAQSQLRNPSPLDLPAPCLSDPVKAFSLFNAV